MAATLHPPSEGQEEFYSRTFLFQSKRTFRAGLNCEVSQSGKYDSAN